MSDRSCTSLSQFFDKLRQEKKHDYSIQPEIVCGRVEQVKVNFDLLRIQFQKYLEIAYTYWYNLDDVTRRGNGDGRDFIKRGCKGLAIVMVHQLYVFLAHKAHVFLGETRARELYDYYFSSESRLVEIPDGCAFIIEQFGMSKQVEAPGNDRIFHVWDGEYKDTLGVPGNVHATSSHSVVLSFLDCLRSAGVKMRKVRVVDCPSRSLWDSLYVQEVHGGEGPCVFSFSTTYSRNHYILPRDIFLAFAFCKPVTNNDSDSGKAIDFYPSRLLPGSLHPTPHVAGGGRDDSEESKRKLDKNIRICTVGRFVYESDVFEFYRILFRHGA